MAVPLLDLSEQHAELMPALKDAFAKVVDSGGFILGPWVERFEQQLADDCGARHCIGVTSGTDGLLAVMMAMGIGEGDEVITSPFTFFSTAGSIARTGATPVFVDIDPRTYNIEHRAIAGAITEKTKAIVPVHLYGQACKMDGIMALAQKHGLKVLEDADQAIVPVHLYGLSANMDPILELAKDRGLYVIEDAAQAIGAKYGDKHVGTLGHAGVYSFYPSKNLAGLGDGGAIVTDDDELAHRIQMIRNHGVASDGMSYPIVGGNFRLDAVQAALLSVKLPNLPEYTECRRVHAARYTRKLEDFAVSTPTTYPDRYHVFHQYTIRVHGDGREPLREHLNACGIGNRVYYAKPLHLQPCFAGLGYEPGSLPEAESAAREVLSIPNFPEMTRAQQDEVIEAIRDFFKGD